jgi:alanine dehydrogenase
MTKQLSRCTIVSEIAGTASILIAAELMITNEFGKGLFGNITGVPHRCCYFRCWNSGRIAAKTAIGLGASVKFLITRSQTARLQNNFQRFYLHHTIQIVTKSIKTL